MFCIFTLLTIAMWTPSIDTTHPGTVNRFELSFGPATDDPSKAGRFDLKVTSLLDFTDDNTSIIYWAVKSDSGDLTSNTEYPGFAVLVYCESGNCISSPSSVQLMASGGIMNHTGSQINYVIEEDVTFLDPLLSESIGGSGTDEDPYYYQGSFEYTDSEKTTFKFPTSSEFLTWYSDANLGIHSDFDASLSDLGKFSPNSHPFIIFNKGS